MNGTPFSPLTRRAFLKWSALAGAGFAAAACAPAAAPAGEAGGAATTEAVSAASGEPVAGGMLRYAETGAFNHFSPWQMSNVNMGMYNQVFSRLIWKDDEGNEHGDMAESWEMAEDGLSFTVKMKENIFWHDGQPCNAHDIVTMYGYTQDEELLQENSVQRAATLLEPVADVQALDDYTVQFTFDTPLPYITEILDYFWAIRIDDKSDPAFMENLPIGTGPLQMTEWEPNQHTRYVRHEQYHHEDLPYLDELLFTRLEKSETLIPNLEADGVDGIFGPPLSDIPRLQADDNYWVEISNAAGSIFNIVVNTNMAPLDQKEVRQALSYALNRQAIVESAFFGIAMPITSPFWSPTSLAYREDLVNAHQYDLEKAADLLAQAGVSDLELDINVTSRWPQMKLFCLIWQADLAEIGVTLNVSEVETGRFYDIGGDGNLLGFGLHPWLNGRTSRDPAIFLGTQGNYRGTSELNRYGWENEELEQIVADGAVELDLDARQALYQRANEILVDELPMIQVATDPRVWVWANKVQGPHIDLVGNVTFDKTWISA